MTYRLFKNTCSTQRDRWLILGTRVAQDLVAKIKASEKCLNFVSSPRQHGLLKKRVFLGRNVFTDRSVWQQPHSSLLPSHSNILSTLSRSHHCLGRRNVCSWNNLPDGVSSHPKTCDMLLAIYLHPPGGRGRSLKLFFWYEHGELIKFVTFFSLSLLLFLYSGRVVTRRRRTANFRWEWWWWRERERLVVPRRQLEKKKYIVKNLTLAAQVWWIVCFRDTHLYFPEHLLTSPCCAGSTLPWETPAAPPCGPGCFLPSPMTPAAAAVSSPVPTPSSTETAPGRCQRECSTSWFLII